MNDLTIARALQRDVLGAGHLVVPCGCILRVDGNFPKRPWVHKDRQTHACSRSCQNAYGEKCLRGWINKLTFTNVSDVEFGAAWGAAKKVMSAADEEVVRVNRWEGIHHDGRLFKSLKVGDAPVEKKLVWPPKMSELLKTSK